VAEAGRRARAACASGPLAGDASDAATARPNFTSSLY